MSNISTKLIAAGNTGEPDMFKVLETEEIAFDVNTNSIVTESFTMDFDDVAQLEFRILEKTATNLNSIDYNRTTMIRPGTTSVSITRVPNSAAPDRNQTITCNASSKTISVNTGNTAKFQGSIQIVKYDRTASQTITLLDNNTLTEQTMPSTVTDLSKCFLQPESQYCDGVYIKGPLDTSNINSWHVVYYAYSSSKGGIKITANDKYQVSDIYAGTFYLIEFE